METLTLGYSPCPNDTYIFYALVHGKVDTGGLSFREVLEDVETLNLMALKQGLDVTKVSAGALGVLRKGYVLLRSGGALGRGCGPLVVARNKCRMEELRGKRIAVPGVNTTAFLLLRLYDPSLGGHVVPMPFDEIMPAVCEGDVEAGLIIHESRFTYHEYGLTEIEDLGRWWESETGLPIPLGCIIARRALAKETVLKIEALIRESIVYAQAHPDEAAGYIRGHAQEMRDEVIDQHIGLYVNEFSVDMGDEGTAALERLIGMAQERGIIQPSSVPLFPE